MSSTLSINPEESSHPNPTQTTQQQTSTQTSNQGSSSVTMPSPASASISHYGTPNNNTSSDAILLSRLRSQIEFYFSPQNLSRDTYLQTQLSMHGGMVPMVVIASFPKVRELCAFNTINTSAAAGGADPALLMKAVDGSSIVAVTPDAIWIGPRMPIPPLNLNVVKPRHPPNPNTNANIPSSSNMLTRTSPSFDTPQHSSNASINNLIETSNSNNATATASNKSGRTTVILRDIPSDWPTEKVMAAFITDSVVPKSAKPDVGNTWYIVFATESDAKSAITATKDKFIDGLPIKARVKSDTPVTSANNSTMRSTGEEIPLDPTVPFVVPKSIDASSVNQTNDNISLGDGSGNDYQTLGTSTTRPSSSTLASSTTPSTALPGHHPAHYTSLPITTQHGPSHHGFTNSMPPHTGTSYGYQFSYRQYPPAAGVNTHQQPYPNSANPIIYPHHQLHRHPSSGGGTIQYPSQVYHGYPYISPTAATTSGHRNYFGPNNNNNASNNAYRNHYNNSYNGDHSTNGSNRNNSNQSSMSAIHQESGKNSYGVNNRPMYTNKLNNDPMRQQQQQSQQGRKTKVKRSNSMNGSNNNNNNRSRFGSHSGSEVGADNNPTARASPPDQSAYSSSLPESTTRKLDHTNSSGDNNNSGGAKGKYYDGMNQQQSGKSSHDRPSSDVGYSQNMADSGVDGGRSNNKYNNKKKKNYKQQNSRGDGSREQGSKKGNSINMEVMTNFSDTSLFPALSPTSAKEPQDGPTTSTTTSQISFSGYADALRQANKPKSKIPSSSTSDVKNSNDSNTNINNESPGNNGESGKTDIDDAMSSMRLSLPTLVSGTATNSTTVAVGALTGIKSTSAAPDIVDTKIPSSKGGKDVSVLPTSISTPTTSSSTDNDTFVSTPSDPTPKEAGSMQAKTKNVVDDKSSLKSPVKASTTSSSFPVKDKTSSDAPWGAKRSFIDVVLKQP